MGEERLCGMLRDELEMNPRKLSPHLTRCVVSPVHHLELEAGVQQWLVKIKTSSLFRHVRNAHSLFFSNSMLWIFIHGFRRPLHISFNLTLT